MEKVQTKRNLEKFKSKPILDDIANEITINGIDYVLLDFDNEFTLQHYIIAKPMLNEIISLLLAKIKNLNPDDVLKSKDLDKALELSLALELSSEMLAFNKDVELLALIYAEKDKKQYNETEYNARIENMKQMNLQQHELMMKSLSNFLSLKLKYTQQNANIYLTAINL